MEEAGEGGRELLRPVWKKKQWWSEKPPLSLSIRRSPFIERGNNRTTRNLEARINEESHSPPLREAQPSQSRSGGQSGFPSREAPPAAHAKKRTSPAVVATDDDAAAAADNNNAWETAECEKNAQGVTCFVVYISVASTFHTCETPASLNFNTRKCLSIISYLYRDS